MNSLVSTDIAAGAPKSAGSSGEFVDFAGERQYVIRNVDQMEPFFISVISSDDHWLFASSNGGLTAGRVSPETALFPYVTVDKVHESTPHTGGVTVVRCDTSNGVELWEPFNRAHDGRHKVSRHLYKNVLGNKLCFEEINHDLGLAFRQTWLTSRRYGFIRQCELENLGNRARQVDVVDGLQNLLPAGTPRFTQATASNLVNAYKWTELDTDTGLAFLTLYSGITDRAEPCESLRATTVFSLGLTEHQILISSEQLKAFRIGLPVEPEHLKRGIRGAYLIHHRLQLAPAQLSQWRIVADLEQSQAEAVALRHELADPDAVNERIDRSIEADSGELASIMASADGFQATAEESVTVHHYANVLFNVLRGGIFNDQYQVSASDFRATVRHFNRPLYERHRELLDHLPERLAYASLQSAMQATADPQLERLALEYLPITFGRRHGDPSRPWNQFAIRIKDEHDNPLLSYQGNWRDIFQNWEALVFSYPGFAESVIAKFVNASTLDGYNPYRITKEGIDWEVEEPDNPWSYIGYWGDHQIIYLLKLLELSSQFHPSRLRVLLRQSVFSYANVPYRIKPFSALLADPKSTVTFDQQLAEDIERRVASMGADGKLVMDGSENVVQVNLLEKLLVPLLSKLCNLVVDGGIWLNTQRPEWNDANNALVGQGLSVVTLNYMRRYICFLQDLLAEESQSFQISTEVADWLQQTADGLAQLRPMLGQGPLDDQSRFASLKQLGEAASRFRQGVYQRGLSSDRVECPVASILSMLEDALAAADHSIASNRREDGLYHAYNILVPAEDRLAVEHLYTMLEGQVAALTSGAVDHRAAVALLEALFSSDVYRADQHSFMLYPDRELPGFLDKNRVDADRIAAIPLLQGMLDNDDERIVLRDADDCCRFNPQFRNIGDLNAALDGLSDVSSAEIDAARAMIKALYEDVFNHKAFTGRSGTMFGFEGLGSIYWHMVSKLLLAVQENFFAARDAGSDPESCQRLGQLYYDIREGLGFNKTPQEYGAFPTDPYSHTPKHAGARQPGMTGQVKEEVLSRFGELGVRVRSGQVGFDPALLRVREFLEQPSSLCYSDIEDHWQCIDVPSQGLAFTWCQVPVIYVLGDHDPSVSLQMADASEQTFSTLDLPAEQSVELFDRSGHIRKITVNLPRSALFPD